MIRSFPVKVDDSLVGGGGDDIFRIGTDGGDDTVSGGSGDDVARFDTLSSDATVSAPDSNGVRTIHFASTGQTITIDGVETLHFTDSNVTSVVWSDSAENLGRSGSSGPPHFAISECNVESLQFPRLAC